MSTQTSDKEFYRAAGTQRNNSLTSFNSFNSFASSTMDHSHTHIPRGSSTNDLLTVETRFSRPSRARPHMKHSISHGSLSSQSAAGQRFNSITSTASNNRPSPRTNSLQPGAMPELYANSFRSSNSMTNIPSFRRQSVQNAHMNQFKQQFHQQRRSQQQMFQVGVPEPSQAPAPSRRSSRMPQAPFTFPNGEVYIPRNKQRNSLTNLQKLNTDVPLVPHSFPLSPRSPRKSESAPKLVMAPVKPQIHVYSSHEPTLSTTSNTNSFSSSPSPSRASRTNSSVNESTPPSSIDDLTIQTSYNDCIIPENNPNQEFTFNGSSSNLGKIEEHSIIFPTQSHPSAATPTSLVSDSTLQLQPSPMSPPRALSPQKPAQPDETVEFVELSVELPTVEPTIPAPAQSTQTPPAPTPASFSSPVQVSTPAVTQSPLARLVPQSQSSPPSRVQSPHKSQSLNPLRSKLSKQSLRRVQSTEIERKPSAIKRFFSKVFSSKKSKPTKGSTPSAPVAQRASSPLKKTTTVERLSDPLAPLTKPQNLSDSHPLQREMSKGSDVFSFMDGDEDKGINVGDLKDMKLDELDFGEDVNLDSLFNSSSNNSSTENAGIVAKRVDDAPEEVLTVKKVRDKPVVENDDEDAVITFDDLEFIEKMIEYGETSFPDLSASDLGQSQRKMMRSKSVERKKSIRSISSASKLSLAPSEASTIDLAEERHVEQNIEVIYSNQRRSPSPSLASGPSILKKQQQKAKHPSRLPQPSSSKKVEFTNQIYVNSTYPPYIYDRQSTAVSSYQLSPQLIQQIRQELNEYKRSMVVHEASLANTQFFRA